MPGEIAAVSYLRLGERPCLVAQECRDCSALYLDRRNACAKCFGTSFGPRELATEGAITSFTIVQRAAKGQDAPYTSCVVELNGGGVVKANLRGVTDPALISSRLKVRLVTFPAGVDDEGTTALAFGFEPVGAGA